MEKIVYHGSLIDNLDEIKARKSTHQKLCIYATSDKTVAFLFMGKGRGDLDKMIFTHNGQLSLLERRPGILNQLYNKEGFLYELDGATFDHYDYLWSKEVISFETSIKPLRKIYIPNILEAINEEAQKGNLIIYAYPSRPSNVPLDNSDLIDKYIRFEREGLTGAIKDLLEVYPEFEDEIKKRIEN